MKNLIKEESNAETIALGSITEEHIIVTIIRDDICILIDESYGRGQWKFIPLSNHLVRNNCYGTKKPRLEQIASYLEDHEMYVFDTFLEVMEYAVKYYNHRK